MAPNPPADAIRIDDTMVVWFVDGQTKWAFVPAPTPAPAAPAPSRRPTLWLKFAGIVLAVMVLIPLGVALLPVGVPAGIGVFIFLIGRAALRRRRSRR